MPVEKFIRQYGLWYSPITPLSLARGLTFSDVAWGDNGALVWLENRSDRGTLVVQLDPQQAPRDLNSEFSARAKVGYGGGDFCVGAGFVFFVDAASARIYRQPLASGTVLPVTPAFGQAAAPALSPDGRWLLYVHTYEDSDCLAVAPAHGQAWPRKLVSGADFYMQPAWSLDGQRICWVEWDFPHMPWDGTTLKLAELEFSAPGEPSVSEAQAIAGGDGASIFQPQFSPDGRWLAFISDASGWGQLYLFDLASRQARQLTHAEAEHGAPAWIQGLSRFAFSPSGESIFFLRNQRGFISLWRVDLASGEEQPIALPDEYTRLDQVRLSPDGRQVALLASGGAAPPRVITLEWETGRLLVRRRAASEELPAEAYARPQAITWEGMDGGQVHGLFSPPHNPVFEGRGLPPLIVRVHGGPTSQVQAGFIPEVQFFVSRGYAVLDVNYRGSTGYGRAYQDALLGNWGIYDVQDSVSGARALAEKGLVDSTRIVIMGGSAGGFTVLKALEDYPDFFKAGICLYGVSNQFTAAADTHKFEARYSDMLLGPLPEAAELYRQRSPVYYADQIRRPLALFQGEDDRVVPRQQSDEVVAALRRLGIPHIYHVYPGEGHGFRKAETIEHFYRAVEAFLREYVIFS